MRVDLELVLAVDVSRSIDEGEARLQREGTIAAIRNPEIVRAIGSGYYKRIAVAYIDFSSQSFHQVIVDWTIISDQASAEAFARKLLEAPLSFGQRTSISDAIDSGTQMIEENNFDGIRRVIDVSGDGPNNNGRLVTDARADALAKRITINGLPIISEPGGFGSGFWLEDLDKYYQGCVIGGPGAFIVVARDFGDFARAIRRKLIFEIAGLSPAAPDPIRKAASPIGPGGTGYVYEKGCDVGEKRWMRRFQGGYDYN